MGFITFNEGYYRRALARLENKSLSADEVYEAKQILKVLDDLADEGYTTLNHHLESQYACLSRLRQIIKKAGDAPFELNHDRLPKTQYGDKEYELISLIDHLRSDASAQKTHFNSTFLTDIRNYCDWIGYTKETAYVFLFRDALLPYLYYRSKGRENLYAWMINRSFLQDVTGVPEVDDDIRLPIYEALESGHVSFEEYHAYCKDRILSVLEQHLELKKALSGLLLSIKEKKIVVVESGYCGTIPMMLSAMDDRVTFRLYTTAPFLYETYKNDIYCRRYEDLRKFETLYSQDLLLQYSSFCENRFYVKVSESQAVRERALTEMKYFI